MKALLLTICLLALAFTAHAADVTLQWDANTESDLAGYRVYQGNGGDLGAFTRVQEIAAPTTSATINGLDNTSHSFAVTAYNTAGRFYQGVSESYSAVKAAPFGTFAGGKFFGARGVWLKGVTDPMQMQLIDAAGVVRTPPVSIAVAVSGVVSGDRVLVARSSGGVVNKSQFTISSVTSNTIVATTTIPTDVPATGVIRIGDVQYTYTGKSSATFTGVSPDPTGKTGGFYVPLIDAEATGAIVSAPAITYLSDFDVIARVRKKGILPFENTGTVGSGGLTISAIRTTDNIAV